MIENDCEDQGYSRISDGCARCRTDEVIEKLGRALKPDDPVKAGNCWKHGPFLGEWCTAPGCHEPP